VQELWLIRARVAQVFRLQELRCPAAAHLRELWGNRAPDLVLPQLVKKDGWTSKPGHGAADCADEFADSKGDSDNACAFFKFPQVHRAQFNLFLNSPCAPVPARPCLRAFAFVPAPAGRHLMPTLIS